MIQAVALAIIALILSPGWLFYFDITPKLVVLLLASGVAVLPARRSRLMGLVILTFLTQGSMLKSLMMALLGLLIGLVGLDPFTASPRFTLGFKELMDGVGIVPLVMGLFGISEVLLNLEETLNRDIYKTELTGLLASLKGSFEAKWAILRGTVIGFFSGILPGGGAVLSSFVSYALEKRFSRHPERFGTGVIEGVAAPESANNAAAQSCLIPLLSLGIPPNVVMAVLYGGLLIHGIQPGPFLVKDHPDVFWGLVMSMYLGNVMLLILNLPLVGLWVQFLRLPYKILFPIIFLLCVIVAGVYGAATVSRRILYVQAAPAAIALILLWLA